MSLMASRVVPVTLYARQAEADMSVVVDGPTSQPGIAVRRPVPDATDPVDTRVAMRTLIIPTSEYSRAAT